MDGGARVADDSIGGDGRQVIRSPEQVALDVPIAGPTSRILAYAIDYSAILLIEVIFFALFLMTPSMLAKLQAALGKVADAARKGQLTQLEPGAGALSLLALFLVLQFAIEWGYFIFWEMTTGGRSPGKACVGLRVIRDAGLPIGLRESFVRNLLRAADSLPMNYGVGLVAMIASREGKRLGDLAAGTIVVRLDRPPEALPLPSAPESGVVFRFEPAHIQRLGADERALIRQTLRRLETLAADQAPAVLERSAEVVRRRIGYAPVEPEQREAFLRALLDARRRG